MALTYNTDAAVQSAKVAQANFIVTLTIDLDDSYPSGGYDLSGIVAALQGQVENTYTVLHVAALPDGTYDFHYDSVNNKLLVFVSATGAEVAGSVDLQAVTGVQLTVWAE
jgi:hypothetical protein